VASLLSPGSPCCEFNRGIGTDHPLARFALTGAASGGIMSASKHGVQAQTLPALSFYEATIFRQVVELHEMKSEAGAH
jgi:hypothetical protein